MAKKLNVSLSFSADTGRAKAQLQDLQKTLDQLMTSSSGKNSLGKDLSEGARAAAELSAHLKTATNAKTGNLDFSKLNTQLKQAKVDLSDYSRTLLKSGETGKTAFKQLATAIADSEIPLRRASAVLTEMGTVLKNTIRWQLSSSLLHGFMGAVQSAYGYVQDLNESLNNIRIVTGQSSEQMARFAEQANKAAKALSTTTTAYTDAALIYYQQGLNDQQVQERTEATIKLANVSRQSAEDVSQQLTAVWNNFDDGTRSLESYVDVMTKLGAETASSSSEIATGLEKFAAVADTVGLSFDNAAAALATITATTRQSADVVGTALKTLFARIQDLDLGQTLDDGTTLGKYSEALYSVGINIKDQQGNLKDMDVILDEMGKKWKTLSNDQQVALAQTVAGTRQYTQLIALMDNFDFYQENLQRAATSQGTLNKQAEIYAESWEAASKRVQASAENIYSSLLDDNFFIGLTDRLAGLLDRVQNFIDGIGGVHFHIGGVDGEIIGDIPIAFDLRQR